MTAATLAPAVEQFTTADVLNMLSGAADYWSAPRIECADCLSSPGGICRDHDQDNRMEFLASLLSDGLKAAGEAGDEVIAALAGLGRAARKSGAAALVSGQEGETR